MPIVLTRATKQDARYKALGGREHCSACRFYMPQGTCGRIIGPVSPEGWCKYYSREAVQRWSNPGYAGGGPGFPAGASLDLSFLTPGTLDPRITFTRASTATYTDASGTIRTAATNAPRWDYDPVTHALRGLLIEEARTNIVPTSVPTTGWTAQNITIIGAAGTAPDGTNTMVRLVETAVNNFHTGTLNLAVITASTAYTLSAYAKAGENRYLQLVFDGGALSLCATFDLLAGNISGVATAAGGATVPTATIQSVGSGIYRCVLSGMLGASTNARAALTLTNAPNLGPYPGYAGNAANGLYVWGVQLEQGAFPTSYIPTTAAAVTRAQDQPAISSVNMSPWFVSPGGSWFAEFIQFNPSNNLRIIGAGGGGGGQAPLFANTGGGTLGQYDGAIIMSTANSMALGAVQKGASNFTPSIGKLCLNGGAVASASMTGSYAALGANGINLFSDQNHVASSTGYIRRISYWPRVLSDAEMQQVTT